MSQQESKSDSLTTFQLQKLMPHGQFAPASTSSNVTYPRVVLRPCRHHMQKGGGKRGAIKRHGQAVDHSLHSLWQKVVTGTAAVLTLQYSHAPTALAESLFTVLEKDPVEPFVLYGNTR